MTPKSKLALRDATKPLAVISLNSLPMRKSFAANPRALRPTAPLSVTAPLRMRSTACVPVCIFCAVPFRSSWNAPLIGRTMPLALTSMLPARSRSARAPKGARLATLAAISPLKARSSILPLRSKLRPLPAILAAASSTGEPARHAPSMTSAILFPSASAISARSAEMPSIPPLTLKVIWRLAASFRFSATPPISSAML